MFHTKQDVDRHVVAIFKNLNSESERNLKCYRIAKHYYAVDDYKSAIRYINRYLSENSNSAAAHKLLGECYLKLNMKVKALDAFKTSLEHDGGQKDLALKVCELLSDPEIPLDVSRATYWLERTESFHPKDPVIFKLKEHLLKYGTNGQKNSAELEKLILAEVTAHPTDVTVRIRLLKFFIEFKRYQVAYEHALELEDRQIFYNDLQWYNCLCDVVEEYEKSSENEIDRDLGFEFFIRKITFLERRADLSMQEFHIDSKLTVDCSSAVFALDQALHAASKLKVPESEKEFLNEFLRHMGAQLCFHMATLVLKRAKKEYGIWSKVTASASPLLFLACQNTTFVEDAWYNSWLDRNKYQMNVWNKAMALRLSQAGHILRTLARDKENQFLQKVSQFCGGKWRTRVYLDVFYNRKHQLATATSYFLNNSGFANVVLQLMTDEELVSFDELSQLAYPESLNHLVWLGLVSFKTDGQLSEQFRCNVLPDLQFSVDKLYNTGPETLNQLDVDAFLYASVLCAKSLTPNNTTSEKPSLLPVSISEDLCTPAQADWWSAVYKVYRNKGNENISEIRLKLRKGIETVRVLGLHGLHIRLIVLLAKLFQERASKEKNSDRAKSLEARSNLYWSMAITPLEKLEKNEEIRVVPNRLFDYRGKELTPNEVKNYLEDGRLFLACRLMKQGMHEQAIEKFSALKSSYATYYQGLIYKQMAMDVVNQRPESITSENRSQHVILLTRARDAFFLTLERLRNPGVDYDHPLNSQIHTHLEEIESQLARIDTDSSKNRNGDVETDESDAGPCPGYSDADNSVTAYNNSGFLNDSALSVTRRSFRTKQNNSRSESKPSLERIDAHLRHLVEANKNELKEIKGAIQKGLINEVKLVRNEIKDLRIVFYDMLSEFRKLNRNKNGVPFVKRDMEPLDCMHGDDPESMVQISQQYPNYQNYPGYHHIPTCQASTSVSFGTPVVPPVSNVLQHGNIPTSIMPNTFFSPQRPMAATDPLLFYQGLSYYTQGGPLSFADNQNLASYRNTAAQKPSFLPGNSATDIHTTTTVSPTKPPMTVPVSTPSEQLPPSSIGVGATSTQMKEFTPSTPAVTKSPSGQAHAFQIPMPPQANLVKSPSENLWTNLQTPTKDSLFSNSNTLITSSPTADGQANSSGSLNTSTRSNSSYIPSEPDPLPDFKPIIPLPDEVKIIPDEATETKLFESRAKLLMFVDKEWVERGVGIVKVLHNEKTQKVRILMRRDQVFKICANHFILPEIELKPFNKDERSLLWSAKDDSDGELVVRTFCIRFSTLDEAKDFQFAFDKGREIARESAAKKKQEKSVNLTPPSNKSDKWECPTCKNKYDSDVKECTACQGKAKEQQKSIFGGFTITSPAEFKISSPKTDTTSNVEATDKTKPNPFASFAFKMPTTTQPSTDTKSTLSESKPILTGNISFESLASSGAVGDGFKRSENFKGFEGKGSLVFGYLDKQKEAEKTKEKLDTSKGNEDEEEGVTHAGDFVPTAEFTPVIPLPDLIEVKTGEEEEIVLYKERSKLLRFVSETKEWKERGLGEMKVLLNEKSGKVRLLMRREQVLKVCCNHFLDENMKFEPMTRNEKAITWCAQDYSEGDLKTELLALKFGKAESMQAFKKVIEEYQSKMKNGRIIGTKVAEEPKSTTDKEAKPLSEIFKPTPGSWECGSCYLRNNADSTKCVSCETLKPGTGGGTEGKSEIKGLQFDPSLASKFSFGIPSTNVSQPAAPVTTSASTPSIFGSFGSKTSSEPLKFTFGLPAADSVEKKPSDGSNIFASMKPPTFVFSVGKPGVDQKENSQGQTTTENKPVTSTTSLTGNKEFVFGSPATFNFGVSPNQTTFGTPVNTGDSKVTGFLDNADKMKTNTGSVLQIQTPNKDTKNTTPVMSSPAVDEIKRFIDDANENKLFESKGKLLIFLNKKWIERGVGIIKILHNEKTKKVRLVMHSDQVFKLLANHFILPNIELKQSSKDERALVWIASDSSDGDPVIRKFCIRFETLDEVKDFKYAFEKGKEIAGEGINEDNKTKTVPKSEPKKDMWQCSACKNKYDSDVKECTVCQAKAKEQQKSIFGGFTITSPAEFKISSPKTDTTSNIEATDKTKPNPFASFAFKMPTTTQPSTDTKSTLSESKPILTGNISFESLASSGAVGDGFKRSENFKGFEGKGSLVFGYLDKQKEAEKTKEKLDTSKGNEDEEEGVTHAGDFVPTAEFTPVIPLPDLIEVKTGEEEEIVLYKERSKLLRFVSETKEWKERGLGEMKVLLNEKSGKVRLLMRREQVLKVCCNHFLDENMKFEPMTRNEKAITWCAQDYSEGDLKTELLALKFGKAESMQAFKKVIEEYQSKMKNGRIIGTKVTEEPTSTTDKEAKPLSEIFKPTPGSWECGSCYLRNNADSTKCVSCETPKPGTGGSTEGKSEIKGLQFDPSLASKFSFGIPNMNICQPSAPVTTSASTPSIFGGFGSKTSSEPLKFTFGLPAADSVEKKTSEGSNIFGCLKPPSFVFSAGKIGGDSLNNSLKDNVTTKVGEDPSNEDLSIVYEAKVTEEDREKAMKLMLPPNFYLYRDAADCPGCVGCDKEGGETNEATAVAASEKPAETKLFGQAPWSSQSGSFGSFKFNWGNADSNFSFNFGNTISPFATKEKSNPNSESGDDMYEEQAEDEDENDEERYDEYYDNDEEDEEGAEELEEEGGEDEVEDEDEDEDEGEDEVQDEGCEDGEQEEGEYVEEEEDNESPSDTGENSIVSKWYGFKIGLAPKANAFSFDGRVHSQIFMSL